LLLDVVEQAHGASFVFGEQSIEIYGTAAGRFPPGLDWNERGCRMTFFQDGPVLGNQYHEDSLLRSALSRLLPPSLLAEVEPDLVRLGGRAVTDLPGMAADAERNAPRLVSFDPWGRRIDRIEVAEGWKRLEAVAAEEGLVATGYERRFGASSRVVQFAKLCPWR
jgi:putative acyl-CoA dehydrogenase